MVHDKVGGKEREESIEVWRAMRLDELVQCTRARAGRVSSSRSQIYDQFRRWSKLFRADPAQLIAAWTEAFDVPTDELINLLGTDRRALIESRSYEWVDRMRRTLNLYDEAEIDVSTDVPEPEMSLCCIAWPWLRTARDELWNRCSRLSHARAFDVGHAQRILYKRLLLEVSELLQRTVSMEVNAARLRGMLTGATPAARFESFCKLFSSPRYGLELWCEYISLARLLTEAAGRWVESSERLLFRLEKDWEHLHGVSLLRHEAGSLQGVVLSGDSHNSGERVAILSFSSGQHVVYKPRSVAGERAFESVVSWLERAGIRAPKTPKIIDRGSYGWAEYVSAVPVDSSSAVEDYYYRCGTLLGVADICGIRDLTNENIIACAGVPFVVDAECMWWPKLRLEDREFVWHESLLSCGLLPGIEVERGIDLSGLSGKGGQLKTLKTNTAKDWNTDRLRFERTPAAFEGGHNEPGRDSEPGEHVDALVSGFLDVYKSGLVIGSGVPSASDADSGSGHNRFRYIPRASAAYHVVASECLHPNLLRDSLDAEALIARCLFHNPARRLLFRHERASIWMRDVPTFSVEPESTSLWSSDGEEISGFFEQSGVLRSEGQLKSASDAIALMSKCNLIRMTLKKPRRRFTSALSQDANLYSMCLELSAEIGRYLWEESDRSTGMTTWVHRTEDAAARIAGQERVEFLRDDLYSGRGGILVLFAALARATGDILFRHAAKELHTQLVKGLQREMDRLDVYVPDRGVCGGYEGLPATLYALILSAEFGDSTVLKVLCEQLCNRCISWIPKDRSYDLIAGTAGLIAVVDACSRQFPDLRTEVIFRTAGDHLLATAQEGPFGLAWTSQDKEPLTGLAHGASGIALALQKTWQATGEQRFKAAALNALKWESSQYVPSQRNWRDLRSWMEGPDERCCAAWCSGAPGVALSRLVMSEPDYETTLKDDLANATLTTSRSICNLPTDGLCHGNFGNLEILYTIAWESTPELVPLAEGHLRTMLNRVTEEGFRFVGTSYPLGFMLGLSGIAYSLLRISTNGGIPSVLSLDSRSRRLAGSIVARQLREGVVDELQVV